MLTADLDHLVAEGETFEVEFKGESRAVLSDSDIVEAVVCLANGQGGLLLIGVEDDGRITGSRPRHGATTDPRRTEALVSNSTRPSLAVSAELVPHAAGSVLSIRVPKASSPVATTRGRYLRRARGADGKPTCVPYFVTEMTVPSGPTDPMLAVIPGATLADIDPLEIERVRRFVAENAARSDQALGSLSDVDLCKALGAVDANGTVTGVRKLGLLLFGKEQSLVKLMPTQECAWQDLHGTEVGDNAFFHWPLLRVFEEMTSRFRVRNRSVEVVDLFRTQIPDFAEEGFREALANALVHRGMCASMGRSREPGWPACAGSTNDWLPASCRD
jgi:ATP-dependent DNA helicase RecG